MTGPLDIAAHLALDPASRAGARTGVGSDARRQAFAALVRRHLETLYGLARRLGPNPADAEDIVQDVLLKAWRGLDRFRHEADPSTWLYRILLNTCHDQVRRKLRRERWGGRTRQQAPDPARQAAHRETVDRVLEGVSRLPRRQRECILLRARAGLTYREVAHLLGIQEGVVRQHLVLARKALVRRFGDDLLDGERRTR